MLETHQPRALVYRGPASSEGCPEAVAGLLARSLWGFEVRYVGPAEDLPLTRATLAAAAVYAQPGGGSLRAGYRRMRRHARDIGGFVRRGGCYLGFCLGGYLAGATPGFNLLPGDTDQYIGSRGAAVRTERDTVVEVCWRERTRKVYFQDGPHFELEPNAPDVTVLARYGNGLIAALVAGHGAGQVGVVGPHPEASPDWYADYGLAYPDGGTDDLGQDLVDTAMTRHSGGI